MKKFIIYTFIGSLPWTMFILYIGMILGENWKTMLAVGHEASLVVSAILVLTCAFYYIRWKRNKKRPLNNKYGHYSIIRFTSRL